MFLIFYIRSEFSQINRKKGFREAKTISKFQISIWYTHSSLDNGYDPTDTIFILLFLS